VIAAEQEGCRPADLEEAALQLARRLGADLDLPLIPVDTKNIDASPLAALHFGKALSHYYAGDMDAAIMQFMRTTDLDPDLIESHYFCGLAYAKLNQPRDAIVEWKILLRRSPQSPYAQRAQKLLAEAEVSAGNEHPIPHPGADATQNANPADKSGVGGKP
jgi:tetratricopeptide (TPR) repeat protein